MTTIPDFRGRKRRVGRKEGKPMMSRWLKTATSMIKSEDGPTSVEYAVMIALIVLLAFAAISGLGSAVSARFTDLDAKLTAGS